MEKKYPRSKHNNIVIQEFGDEILIYDFSADKASSLNRTSAMVWRLADGSKSVSEISGEMSETLKTSVSEEFVMLALSELERENLLENNPEKSFTFDNLSRREVIRKIGLSSMITLPLVSSIIAPAAANAASNCVYSPKSSTVPSGGYNSTTCINNSSAFPVINCCAPPPQSTTRSCNCTTSAPFTCTYTSVCQTV